MVVLIEATLAAEEFQVTELVTSCYELSVNVPVAVNCCAVPKEMDAAAGVMAKDTSVAGVTVILVEPAIAPF